MQAFVTSDGVLVTKKNAINNELQTSGGLLGKG